MLKLSHIKKSYKKNEVLTDISFTFEEGASKPTEEYQTANGGQMMLGSQTARDKLGGQKGKSPDLQLRSQSAC